MQKNVGTVDRVIRIVVAAVILGVLLGKLVTGVLAVVLGIVAVALIVTALISWCGLYQLLGVNTGKGCSESCSCNAEKKSE